MKQFNPGDPVSWLTNGVGELPIIDHDAGEDGGALGAFNLLVADGQLQAIVPISSDLGVDGARNVADALAGAGHVILWYREQLLRIQAQCWRGLDNDGGKSGERSMRRTLEYIAGFQQEPEPWPRGEFKP